MKACRLVVRLLFGRCRIPGWKFYTDCNSIVHTVWHRFMASGTLCRDYVWNNSFVHTCSWPFSFCIAGESIMLELQVHPSVSLYSSIEAWLV